VRSLPYPVQLQAELEAARAILNAALVEGNSYPFDEEMDALTFKAYFLSHDAFVLKDASTQEVGARMIAWVGSDSHKMHNRGGPWGPALTRGDPLGPVYSLHPTPRNPCMIGLLTDRDCVTQNNVAFICRSLPSISLPQRSLASST